MFTKISNAWWLTFYGVQRIFGEGTIRFNVVYDNGTKTVIKMGYVGNPDWKTTDGWIAECKKRSLDEMGNHIVECEYVGMTRRS